MTTTARQLDSPPPFSILPQPVEVCVLPSLDDGPVALRVVPFPPQTAVSEPLVADARRATGRAHRNASPRKAERSHAHDRWHYARTPRSHLPADMSDQWWRETKAMIDRGYDRFVARRHLNRHAPEWSISNWGVCAGVHFDKP